MASESYVQIAEKLHGQIFKHWHETVDEDTCPFLSPKYLKGVEALIAASFKERGLKIPDEHIALMARHIPFIDFEPEIEGPDDKAYVLREEKEVENLAAIIQRVVEFRASGSQEPEIGQN